jgi:hypothetical protein
MAGCCGNNIFSQLWAQFQTAIQTPFTTILGDVNHIPVAGPTVQDAINNLSIYLANLTGADIYVDGGTYNPTTQILTLTDNSGFTPNVTINLAELRKTQGAITVNGVPYPVGTDFEAILAALNLSETTTTLINTVAGHKIGNYINEIGANVPINETISTVTSSANGFSYTNEAGVLVSTTFIVNGTNLEISVGGTLVSTIPLTLNEIQINNAGSDFDLTDDIISFVETNGDTATINFSKYNISAVINPNGSTDIFQNGNLITTIQKPVVVNNVPLAVVINPLVVQTTNLASIVTDSAGDKFYIDYLGNATKITTDFLLTVNAGTTNVVTDASLGSATVGNGGTIHLWSSDGSILFGVVQGSAITGMNTNSNIIPFTPSLPVLNDAGLASLTVQGAIDEVDGKVETLEDRNRPYAKQGDVQATNSEDVLVTDNIFHLGDQIIGDDGTLMPFDVRFKQQIYGNENVEGFIQTHGVFSLDDKLAYYDLYIDPIGGNDGLLDHEYLIKNGLLPANNFKTWNRVVKFLNAYITVRTVYITWLNTTAGSRGLMNASAGIIRRDVQLIIDPFGGTFFLNFTGKLDFSYVRSLLMKRCDITASADQAISSNGLTNNILEFNDCKINYTGTGRLFSVGGSNLSLDAGNTINMLGNGGIVFGNNTANMIGIVNIGYNVGVLNPFIGVKIDAGTSTGIRLTGGSGISSRGLNIYARIPSDLQLLGIIKTTETHFRFNRSQTIGITQGNLSKMNADSDWLGTGYTFGLHGTQPLYFQDLNSASPDGAYVTRKTLFVEENGTVIVGSSTASTDLGIEEDQVATASQTVFTLPVAPIGRLVAYWGGVKLPKGSVTYVGTTATYNPALNGGQNFLAGDVISFVY